MNAFVVRADPRSDRRASLPPPFGAPGGRTTRRGWKVAPRRAAFCGSDRSREALVSLVPPGPGRARA